MENNEEQVLSPEMEELYKNNPASDHRITKNYTILPINNSEFEWKHNETGEVFVGDIDGFNKYLIDMLSNKN